MVQSFDAVEVDVIKLREYCLSESHPRGRHKARVFRSRLGLVANDAKMLRHALLVAARDRQSEILAAHTDEYGQRYILDFEMTTGAGTATIRSAWIVRAGESVLRLTSCYVL
jgi:hypothetical protein